MTEQILVSPLGRSPGAVSGVAFALKAAGWDIRRVITLGTSHPDVLAVAQILDNVFFDDFGYDARHIPAADLREDSADAFVSNFGLALEEANSGGGTVHVAVTAGRSGMGALAALATNLYGTDHLWHFWVDDDIAEGGLIDRLQRPLTKENKFLNPTVGDPELYELVELPFVDLRKLHPIIWNFRETGQAPNSDSPYFEFFASGQLNRLQDVFPAGLTISQLDRIMEMASNASLLSEEEQLVQVEELGRLLAQAGIIDAVMSRRLRLMVAGKASTRQVLTELAEKSRNPWFAKRVWDWLDQNSTQVIAIAAVIEAIAQVAAVYVQSMALK